MYRLHDYQLFLFDFDGLLVNTEEVHFEAYQSMCAKYGFKLDWSFERYCLVAHYQAHGLKEQIYKALPGLQQAEPRWEVLYAYKQEQVLKFLQRGAIKLMPGVNELLTELQAAQIKRCVVTHSTQNLIDTVRVQHPILDTIPHWITREKYKNPKPHPDGYLFAIEQLACEEDKIIGFEDTPRGLEALSKTRSKPVLISTIMYEGLPSGIEQHSSFHDLFSK